MRDVAVVAFAQSHHVRREQRRNEVEMLMPVLHQVKTEVGLDQSQIGRASCRERVLTDV